MYKLSNEQKIGIGAVILTACFILFLIGKYWLADYYYSTSMQEAEAGLYSPSIKDMQTAISYSPNEAIYHNEMSRIFTNITLGFFENNDATTAARVVPYAINESDVAFNLSPRNMNIRETRISMYLELFPFDKIYLQNAVDLIGETIILSPTDPKLPFLLGKTYANMNQIQMAITEFNKALALKPDYNDAKTALSVVLKLQDTKK